MCILGNQKTNGTDRFEDISELRKKAQDQMNMLFCKLLFNKVIVISIIFNIICTY